MNYILNFFTKTFGFLFRKMAFQSGNDSIFNFFKIPIFQIIRRKSDDPLGNCEGSLIYRGRPLSVDQV